MALGERKWSKSQNSVQNTIQMGYSTELRQEKFKLISKPENSASWVSQNGGIAANARVTQILTMCAVRAAAQLTTHETC